MRSKSPSRRSTPRKTATPSKTKTSPKISPHKIANGTSTAIRGAVSRLADIAPQHTLAVTQFLVLAWSISALLAYVVLRYELLSIYICPLVRKMYLTPLGLHKLNERGLILLSVAWHAALTHLLMPIICNLAVPLCSGALVDGSNPRQQKAQLGGICTRLANAQLNLVEGQSLLAVVLMCSFMAGVPDSLVLSVVTFYMWTRKCYVLAYALDATVIRAIVYLAGVNGMMYLFYQCLLRFL